MKNVSQIRQTLIDLPEYRFYSSSLLIIYEGEPGPVSSYEEDKTDNSMDCEQFEEARTSGESGSGYKERAESEA